MSDSMINTSFDLFRFTNTNEELCGKYQRETIPQDLFLPDGTERYKKSNFTWGALLHVFLDAHLAVREDFEAQGDLKLCNVLSEKSNYNTLSSISSDIPVINGFYQPDQAVPFRHSLLKMKCNIVVAICLCFHENVNGIMLPRMYVLDVLTIENLKQYRHRWENYYDWCVPRIKHKRDIVQKEPLPEFYSKYNKFQLSLRGQNKNLWSQKYNMPFRNYEAITGMQKTCFGLLHQHKQMVVIPPFLKKMDFQIKENEFLNHFYFPRIHI